MNEVHTEGRRWARAFLIIALAVSMIGNVTHTVLADSQISLWLRIPGAVVWPIFTFGAIEIVVRVIWQNRRSHKFARGAVLFPAIPAAITSYEHLFSLLLMMGENKFIAIIGPAAIDGLMIGCTLTLLFTREVKDMIEAVKSVSPAAPAIPTPFDIVAPVVFNGGGKTETFTLPVPVSPAPQSEAKVRAPRATWNVREVCEMAIDGIDKQKANEKTGIGGSTYDRYRRVAKTLKSSPLAEIPASWKVPGEHIRIMREMIAR